MHFQLLSGQMGWGERERREKKKQRERNKGREGERGRESRGFTLGVYPGGYGVYPGGLPWGFTLGVYPGGLGFRVEGLRLRVQGRRFRG